MFETVGGAVGGALGEPVATAWGAWWPWLTVIALGLFHGLNPAMGWLFAVALGLHRGRRVVLLSLVPIALGHALAVGLVLAGAVALGNMLDRELFARAGGVVLILWAGWHALRGHRGRPVVGMRTGMAGLALWSFMMAGAHGAGLMLVPVLLPLCSSGAGTGAATGPLLPVLLALGLHSIAMLIAIGAIALLVYDRIGLGFLRTGWVNVDLVWTAALLVCGAVLLLA